MIICVPDKTAIPCCIHTVTLNPSSNIGSGHLSKTRSSRRPSLMRLFLDDPWWDWTAHDKASCFPPAVSYFSSTGRKGREVIQTWTFVSDRFNKWKVKLKVTARYEVGYWLLSVMGQSLSVHHACVCTNMLGLKPNIHSCSGCLLTGQTACGMDRGICFSRQRNSNTQVVAHSLDLSTKGRRLSVPWVQTLEGNRDSWTVPSNQSVNSCLEMTLWLGGNKTPWGNARPRSRVGCSSQIECFGRERVSVKTKHWDWSGVGVCLCV